MSVSSSSSNSENYWAGEIDYAKGIGVSLKTEATVKLLKPFSSNFKEMMKTNLYPDNSYVFVHFYCEGPNVGNSLAPYPTEGRAS